MTTGNRFDLEKAIAAWRRPFEHNRTFSPEDLEELESGLRDRVSAGVERGQPEEEAFLEAVRRIGSYDRAEAEYAKIFWGERKLRGEIPLEVRWRLSLIGNYLKVAGRRLIRHKGYSAINALGLAIGIGCCMLILLYVRDELSFDRYHEKADRIYRLTTREWARMPPALAPALEQSVPDLVENAVRLWPLFSPAKVRHGDVVFVETGGVFADPGVFSVFSWPLQSGDARTALASPNTMVLTRSMARKYFGDTNPVGATLQFWGNDVTVTGFIEDVPLNAHFRFDFLVSFSTLKNVMGPDLDENWGMPAFFNYVLASRRGSPAAIEEAARNLVDRRKIDMDSPVTVQPLGRIHLYSHLQGDWGPGGNRTYLYLLSTVAALVLVLACVNFTNLTTARATTRMKEIGLRKVLGALRTQLVGQFFSETVLMIAAAVLVALFAVKLSIPFFNQVTGKAIQVRYTTDPVLLFGIPGLIALIGFTAGCYPALFLSRLQPIKGLTGTGGDWAPNLLFRKALVVFQFTVSTALIMSVAVIGLQLGFLLDKDLGFDKDHILVLDGDRFPLVREALLNVPGVVDVAGTPRLPGDPLPTSSYRLNETFADTTHQMAHLGVTPGFIETMGMQLVAGRSFTEASFADRQDSFILNESAVRALGWGSPDKAVGQPFAMFVPPVDGGDETWREGRIIGVVRDFNYQSLYHPIAPTALYPSRDLNQTLVRLRHADTGLLASIGAAWKQVNPDAPYNYYFLGEYLHRGYRSEEQLGWLMNVAAGLAILIACLGLLGLAIFETGRRTREIAVRKVLGASVVRIVACLSSDFIRLVLIAFVLAAPLAYLFLSRWLETFAYRITMNPAVFLLAGSVVVFVAVATISYQALRAARADPVRSLRMD